MKKLTISITGILGLIIAFIISAYYYLPHYFLEKIPNLEYESVDFSINQKTLVLHRVNYHESSKNCKLQFNAEMVSVSLILLNLKPQSINVKDANLKLKEFEGCQKSRSQAEYRKLTMKDFSFAYKDEYSFQGNLVLDKTSENYIQLTGAKDSLKGTIDIKVVKKKESMVSRIQYFLPDISVLHAMHVDVAPFILRKGRLAFNA